MKKKAKPPAAKPKADKRIGVKIADAEKERFLGLLEDDPHYANASDFFNDCMRSYKFQRNRGEALRYPIEFVRDS